MHVKTIKSMIENGETFTVEFKESKNQLNKDVYETVCAFSNRAGGDIFLGLKDNGEIIGVDEDVIEKIKKDFVTTINNPQKLAPPLYLNIETVEIENKKILHIHVPMSKAVHSLNGFADELGSGVKNLYKYSKAYGGSDPVIIEGEIFKLEVQVPSETTQKTTKANGGVRYWE